MQKRYRALKRLNGFELMHMTQMTIEWRYVILCGQVGLPMDRMRLVLECVDEF